MNQQTHQQSYVIQEKTGSLWNGKSVQICFSRKRVKYFLHVHLTLEVSEDLRFTCTGIRIAEKCPVKQLYFFL